MFKEYSFVFDIDGTLCPIKKKDEKYEDLVPYKEMVEKSMQLSMLERAYKELKSYEIDVILKVIFGAPEENEGDTEDGKC